jgi:hypothetical protein
MLATSGYRGALARVWCTRSSLCVFFGASFSSLSRCRKLELLRFSQDSGIAGFFCKQEYSHERSECRQVVCGDFHRDTSNDGCYSVFSVRDCQSWPPLVLASRLHRRGFGAIFADTSCACMHTQQTKRKSAASRHLISCLRTQVADRDVRRRQHTRCRRLLQCLQGTVWGLGFRLLQCLQGKV